MLAEAQGLLDALALPPEARRALVSATDSAANGRARQTLCAAQHAGAKRQPPTYLMTCPTMNSEVQLALAMCLIFHRD